MSWYTSLWYVTYLVQDYLTLCIVFAITFQYGVTSHLTTKEFRHQPTRYQETISPPRKVYSPPSTKCQDELTVQTKFFYLSVNLSFF